MHASRRHAAAAVLAVMIAVGALELCAVASTSTSSASTSVPAGASILPRVAQSTAPLAVLITTRMLTPKVQRTVRFTGYATYIFHAPKGRGIVSASARITGATAHAVKIRRRTISHNRLRYTVRLVFAGEQGNPGKLVVRLGTVA
jgi:hypothetical protein